MQFKKTYKSKTLIFIFLVSLLLIVFNPLNLRYSSIENESHRRVQKIEYYTEDLKSSKISSPIHITGSNWSAAKAAGICTGDGTYSNPYIILGLEIDGGRLANCIIIENSQAYFKIENCTLYNAGEGSWSNPIAGIRLNNTQNGIIKNNTCYLNKDEGIAITYSENLTVLDNNIHDNGRIGLYVVNSNNISIDSNNFDSNHLYGIIFDNSADIDVSNNTMINNSIFNNFYGGINIGDDSTNFTVSDNIFINNNLEISEAYYIDISNNTFINGYIDFYGNYYYLATLNIDIKNRINGQPIYQYKDKVGLGFNNFTYAGIPGQVILSNCNNSIINKLNFSEGLAGIFLFNSSNIKIVECNFTDNEEGILLALVFNITVTKNILANNRGIMLWQSCHNNTFYNNTILYTDFGIEFHGYSNYNNISNNNINYNEHGGIIFNSWSDFNWIINNTLIENEYGIKIKGKANVLMKNKMRNCGIQIDSPSRNYAGSHIIDSSNNINDKAIYYYANKQYLKPINFTKAGPPGQIILANCNNSLITDLSISDSSIGLSLVYCENNSIKGNTFSGNKVYGLSLLHSINNSIYDNDLVNNDECGLNLEEKSNFNNISNNKLNSNGWHGVILWYDCHNNTILDNLIRDNGNVGINFQMGCENNTLSYNTIIYNVRGIRLSYSHNNVITFNDIKNNEDDGISLRKSNNTLILGNKIHFNGHGYIFFPYYGINYYDGYGVYLDESNNNTVTENEFLGNKNNIKEEDCKDNKIYNNYFLTIPPAADDDGDDDDDEDAVIPFGNYYLGFAVIAMLSLIVIIKRKAIFKE